MVITGAQLAMWYLDDPPRVPALARRNARTKFWDLLVRHCCYCGRTHELLGGNGALPAAGPYRARCGGRVFHVVIVWQSPSRASCRKAIAAQRRESQARAASREAKRRARAGAGRGNQRTVKGTNTP